KAVGRVAVGAPLNGTVDVAGPQQFRFDELIRQGLAARNDPREVVVDAQARYFGAEFGERSLVLAGDARLGAISFQEGSKVSDVDLIVVLPDDTTANTMGRLREKIALLEVRFGFRPIQSIGSRGWRSRVERAAGHLFPCCVCTRGQLLSGDVAAVLGLR